jgi:predicted DNA-binding transcriptional regulator YafY
MASRLERVIKVLLLLQSGGSYNAMQIAERTNVHRRTVFRDVALLKSLNIPVAYDSETARYSLPRSFISEAEDITAEELTELLMSACLSFISEGQTAKVTRRVIDRLMSRLPNEGRRELGRVARSFAPRVPADMPNREAKLLDLMLRSIRKGLALEMHVGDHGGESFESLQVAPLRVSFLESGWIVYAYVFPEGPRREIGLTSIRHAMLTESPYSATELEQRCVVPSTFAAMLSLENGAGPLPVE